jgi:hypothetical protein
MHDVPIETRRIQFVLGTMALLLALNVVSAVYELGWQAVTGNVALVLLLDGIYLMFSRDVQLGQWLLFGLAAGWVELCTDWWLVRTGTLVYPADEPIIWASPPICRLHGRSFWCRSARLAPG